MNVTKWKQQDNPNMPKLTIELLFTDVRKEQLLCNMLVKKESKCLYKGFNVKKEIRKHKTLTNNWANFVTKKILNIFHK